MVIVMMSSTRKQFWTRYWISAMRTAQSILKWMEYDQPVFQIVYRMASQGTVEISPKWWPPQSHRERYHCQGHHMEMQWKDFRRSNLTMPLMIYLLNYTLKDQETIPERHSEWNAEPAYLTTSKWLWRSRMELPVGPQIFGLPSRSTNTLRPSVRGSPLIAVMIHVISAITRDYHLEVDTIGHAAKHLLA